MRLTVNTDGSVTAKRNGKSIVVGQMKCKCGKSAQLSKPQFIDFEDPTSLEFLNEPDYREVQTNLDTGWHEHERPLVPPMLTAMVGAKSSNKRPTKKKSSRRISNPKGQPLLIPWK
jgi:hypothetical protein